MPDPALAAIAKVVRSGSPCGRLERSLSYKRMNQTAATPDTARDLIRVARRLFATHGYDGASVRAITSAAHANLGAITYHFGSKQELYNRVVAECAEPLADAVIGALVRDGDVLQRVAHVVRVYFEHISADEDTGRVLLQANVIGKETPETALAAIRRIHAALVGLVVEGQRDGVLRDGDPRLLGLSIVSVPLHLALVRRPLKTNAGIDLDDSAQREAAIAHAIRFVCEALAAHTGKQA
jgi:AcrR family transcriptional regulator